MEKDRTAVVHMYWRCHLYERQKQKCFAITITTAKAHASTVNGCDSMFDEEHGMP